MLKFIRFFHYLSFLQFPMFIMAVFSFISPIWISNISTLDSVSHGLLWIGLALSFGSLAEISPHGKWVLKMKKNPTFLKLWMLSFTFLIITTMGMGILGLSRSEAEARDLWISLIVLGIGLLGQLRMMLEPFRSV